MSVDPPADGGELRFDPLTGEWEPLAAFGAAPTFTRSALTRNTATTTCCRSEIISP